MYNARRESDLGNLTSVVAVAGGRKRLQIGFVTTGLPSTSAGGETSDSSVEMVRRADGRAAEWRSQLSGKAQPRAAGRKAQCRLRAVRPHRCGRRGRRGDRFVTVSLMCVASVTPVADGCDLFYYAVKIKTP